MNDQTPTATERAEKLQGLIDALCESSIDVDTDTEKVKIYCA